MLRVDVVAVIADADIQLKSLFSGSATSSQAITLTTMTKRCSVCLTKGLC